MTHGARGTMSKSGWSNTEVFKQYLSEHFVKYAPCGNGYTLILYDGHRSHIHPDIIEWAKENNIILFVLPPHTSQVLQPLDVGCFGPLQKAYCQEVQKFMQQNIGISVTKYDIASLVCKAYRVAMSASNLCASFKKSGIYPLNPKAFDQNKITPNVVFQHQNKTGEPSQNCGGSSGNVHSDIADTEIDSFISNIEVGVTAHQPTKKERNTLSKISSGKPITEDMVSKAITDHIENQKRKKFKTPYKSRDDSCNCSQSAECVNEPPKKRSCEKQLGQNVPHTPEPGPSHILVESPDFEKHQSDNEEDDEVCCVCKLFSPVDLQRMTSLVIVNWAQCNKCGHWTHLKFCTKTIVCRKNESFFLSTLCP